MLPSHLLDPTKKKNERLSRTRFGDAPPPPPPSLCVTGAMSRIGRYQVVTSNTMRTTGDEGENIAIDDNGGAPIILSYCIFRPRQLHDEQRPPLLCLHGGPSIPSNYLLPIVNGVTDRAVIFYDQWGCGKSSRPEPRTKSDNNSKTKKKVEYPPFSIPTMVEHLRQLVEEHWKLRRFHLLGHSFGGILAYEYLLTTTKKRQEELSSDRQNNFVCSFILSSTPTSAALIQSESERLFRNLDSDGNCENQCTDNDGDDAEDNDTEKSTISSSERQQKQLHKAMMTSEEFRQTHECRLSHPPLALMDALRNMGPPPWRGIQAIEGYEAEEADKSSVDIHMIPSLLMRGEYDLCTEACMKGWKERLGGESNTTEEKVLSNCSHYAMLEDENLYGAEILSFVKMHDSDKPSTI